MFSTSNSVASSARGLDHEVALVFQDAVTHATVFLALLAGWTVKS